MALTSSEVYKLTAERLRQLCSERRLDSEGPIRSLRQRLVRHLSVSKMTSKQEMESEQASARTSLSLSAAVGDPQNSNNSSHVGPGDSPVTVVVELLRKVQTLSSEEPEAILRLVSKLDEIHALEIVDDRMFIVRILPLVSRAVLRFFGDCLRNGRNWAQSKGDLLREFFPHFVHERMVRDLIVFNFHKEGQALREFADSVFAAARFLEYEADEEQLVGRIVMNLHPAILVHAAFLERPRSRKELMNAIGLIEERVLVLKEREKVQPASTTQRENDPRSRRPSQNVPSASRTSRCWNCGSTGHFRRDCHRGGPPVGKRAAARWSVGPRATATVNALRRVTALPPSTFIGWTWNSRQERSLPS